MLFHTIIFTSVYLRASSVYLCVIKSYPHLGDYYV
jgi:hypothetical protein